MLTCASSLISRSDTYYPATDATVEQCCPTFPAQPENVECQDHIVNGFTSVTCTFTANGNTPYAYLVPATDAPAQRRYFRRHPFPTHAELIPSLSQLSTSIFRVVPASRHAFTMEAVALRSTVP